MKKFLVLFRAPVSVLEEWAKTDPEERKSREEKMRGEWMHWMNENAPLFVDMPAGTGKTKVATSQGASDTKNDIMLYAVIQSDSYDTAMKAFEHHPHFGIPESSIEVMEINPLSAA